MHDVCVGLVDVRRKSAGIGARHREHIELAVMAVKSAMKSAVKFNIDRGAHCVHLSFQVGIEEQRASAGLIKYLSEFVLNQCVVDRYMDESGLRAGQPQQYVRVGVFPVGRYPVTFIQA